MSLRTILIIFVFIGLVSKVSAFATDTVQPCGKKQLSLVASSKQQLPVKSTEEPQLQVRISHSSITQVVPLPVALAVLILVLVLIALPVFNFRDVGKEEDLLSKVLFRFIISPNAP